MWYNAIINWLLHSPLHGLISASMMTISYQGRRSGRAYTTPVNYHRLQGEAGEYLLTTSLRARQWWRNLRGGAPVTVRVQGKDYKAMGEAIEAPEAVAADLMALFQSEPRFARYLGVRLDKQGKLVEEEVQKAAQTRVMIHTKIR